MSFATEIKNEISLLDFSLQENIVELSGFVRNNGIKTIDNISLQLENPKVVRRIVSLFKDLFDVNVEVIQANKVNFNRRVVLNLVINQKVDTILKKLMVVDQDLTFLKSPKDYYIDGEDNARSYLRGVFLASGSVNDPKTSRYHLEFWVEY